MNPYINALLLRFDGQDGADVPTGPQVAVTWGIVGALLSRLLK